MLQDPPIVIEGKRAPAAAVIWLHGLGADGLHFASIVKYLGLANRRVRFILPHAPTRAVTINKGEMARAWFDILNDDYISQEDHDGLKKSTLLIESLIKEQIDKGIQSKKIILAGFSQGGALCLYAGLRSLHKLGGILALSSYLPSPSKLTFQASEENIETPIMMMHGLKDSVVPYDLGRSSYNQMVNMNYPIRWNAYEMDHELCEQQIADIKSWFETVLDVDNLLDSLRA